MKKLHTRATEQYVQILRWAIMCVQSVYWYEQKAGVFYNLKHEAGKTYILKPEAEVVYNRFYSLMIKDSVFYEFMDEIDNIESDDKKLINTFLDRQKQLFEPLFADWNKFAIWMKGITPEDRQRNIELIRADLGEELAENIDNYVVPSIVSNHLNQIKDYFTKLRKFAKITEPTTKKTKQIKWDDLEDRFTVPFKNLEEFENFKTDFLNRAPLWDKKQVAAMASIIYNGKVMRTQSKPKAFAQWSRQFSAICNSNESTYKENQIKAEIDALKQAFYYIFP